MINEHNENEKNLDPAAIHVIDHLLIKDADTGQVLVNKRDSKHNRLSVKDLKADTNE